MSKGAFAVLILIFLSCAPENLHRGDVRVRISQFPETSHPLNYSSITANLIVDLLYETLQYRIPDSDSVISRTAYVTAIADQDSLVRFDFRFQEKAIWNQDFEMTSEDVETTLKVMNLPGIDNRRTKVGFSFIKGLSLDESDPKSFSILAEGNIENLKPRIGTFYLLPKHIYDPQGILEGISLESIIDEDSPDIDEISRKYADFLNSEETTQMIKESRLGAYQIEQWTVGQSVQLVKNKDWWGYSSLGNEGLNFYPDTITYELISDESVALLALKGGEIDVLGDISPNEFKLMDESDPERARFHYLSPTSYKFIYLAINSRKSKFTRSIREVISRLVPYQNIININLLGYGQRTIGPINPVDQQYYNPNIPLVETDLETARKIMEESGYSLVDGVWRNEIGENLDMEIIYRSGSSLFENIALIIQDNLQKFGLEVNLKSIDRSLQSQLTKSHDFELSLSSFGGGPLAHNFAPLFSTEAAEIGGLNFSGFGTQRSDSVINLINSAPKKSLKIKAMKELQRMIDEEKTMLFLFFEKNRIAVSKRFSNVQGLSSTPGYDVSQFKLANAN